MADIAILVAEEYERRIKNPAGKAAGDLPEMSSLVSSMSGFARSFKNKIGRENYNDYAYLAAKWANSEPKTQISLAASDGFFSA